MISAHLKKKFKPCFEDPERIRKLTTRAKEIERTPFSPNSHVFDPKGGSDCWAGVNELQVAAGTMPRVVLDRYSSKWMPSRFDVFIREQLAAADWSKSIVWIQITFDRQDPRHDFQIGDIARLRSSGPPHCAVKLAGRDFIHTDPERGIIIEELASRRQVKLIDRIYRAYELIEN